MRVPLQRLLRIRRLMHNSIRTKKKVEIKLLLLGGGESGKTTFMKQMKIINLDGYTNEERGLFFHVIQSNIKNAMKCLVQNALKSPSLALLPESLSYTELFSEESELLDEDKISPKLGMAIATLWRDPSIKQLWEHATEWDFFETVPYFFSEIDRIATPDYIPTVDDILKCRVRTIGINELVFPLKHETNCRLVDVGGQRSERRKWIHCFQGVTSILFFVALSEYDQMLHEAPDVNRMHESIKLFDEVCNGRWFADTNIILFLNKTDLFKEKIVKTDLKVCFSEYTGGNDLNHALNFIKDKFSALNKNNKRTIYIHNTCATDTDQIKKVYVSVRDTVMNTNLQNAGFV